MNLINKAKSGIKWSALSQFSRQLVLITTTMILANLLAPEHFGVFGMVTVITGFAGIFRNLGTSAAVIQKQVTSNELITTLLWVNIALGITVSALITLSAPLIAYFFKEPQVTSLLRIISLGFVASGCSVINQALLEKEMRFKELSIAEMASTTLGALVGITSAYYGEGVWALVYQNLSMTVSLSISLWCIHPLKRFTPISVSTLRPVMNFSLNLTGFNVVNYFIRNADNILIGKFLGAEALGLYSLAYRIMLYPLQSISMVLGRVMFPYFSKLQNDNEDFRKSYIRLIGAIALITFPMMGGIWVVAHDFVAVTFGEKWMPVTAILMILAPVGAMQSIVTTVGGIYQAKGRTDIMFRWGISAGLVFLAGFAIGLKWDIVGVAWGYLLAFLVVFIPGLIIPYQIIKLKLIDAFRAVLRPLIITFFMVLTVYTVKKHLGSNINPTAQLCMLISLGATVYILLNIQFNKTQTANFLRFLRNRNPNN